MRQLLGLTNDHYQTIVYSVDIVILSIQIIYLHTQLFTQVFTPLSALLFPVFLFGIVGYLVTYKKKRRINQ